MAGAVGRAARTGVVVFATAAALLALAAPAAAIDRQCGRVTGVFLGDLPSGGTVSIDGRKFLVGGVGPRNVQLHAPDQLRVGTRACAEGEFRVLADGSVDLFNGRILPDSSGLPATSTAGATAAALPAGIADNGIEVCGRLSSYSTSDGNRLSLNIDGALRSYRLVGNGTVPDALGAQSTALNPERVQLVGRAGQEPETVTDYTVTRVRSCTGLPSTSTAPDLSKTPTAVVVVAGGLFLACLSRQRSRGPQPA